MQSGCGCPQHVGQSRRLVALVIGDTGTIGSALARHLLQEGWYVIGASRTSAAPQDGYPVQLRYQVDAGDRRSVEHLAQVLKTAGTKIDMMVHAYGSDCHLESNNEKVVKHTFETILNSLIAPIVLTNSLLPQLNVDSLVVFFSGGGALQAPEFGWNVSYAAAKTGLHRAAESMALQLASRRVWITIIDPGWVPHPGEGPEMAQPTEKSFFPPATTIRSPNAAALAVSEVFAERGNAISGKLVSVLRNYHEDIVRLKSGDHRKDFLSLRLSDE